MNDKKINVPINDCIVKAIKSKRLCLFSTGNTFSIILCDYRENEQISMQFNLYVVFILEILNEFSKFKHYYMFK